MPQLRVLTDAEVQAAAAGNDYRAFQRAAEHPVLTINATPALRQALFGAAFATIRDSRGLFTSGVKKESSYALRALTPLLSDATAAGVELRRLVDAALLRDLRLGRHLTSGKDDVMPAALDFIYAVAGSLQIPPSQFLDDNARVLVREDAMRRQREQDPATRDAASIAQAATNHAAPPLVRGRPRRTRGDSAVADLQNNRNASGAANESGAQGQQGGGGGGNNTFAGAPGGNGANAENGTAASAASRRAASAHAPATGDVRPALRLPKKANNPPPARNPLAGGLEELSRSNNNVSDRGESPMSPLGAVGRGGGAGGGEGAPQQTLYPVQAPAAVLFFAKHYGLGCVPSMPDGTPLLPKAAEPVPSSPSARSPTNANVVTVPPSAAGPGVAELQTSQNASGRPAPLAVSGREGSGPSASSPQPSPSNRSATTPSRSAAALANVSPVRGAGPAAVRLLGSMVAQITDSDSSSDSDSDSDSDTSDTSDEFEVAPATRVSPTGASPVVADPLATSSTTPTPHPPPGRPSSASPGRVSPADASSSSTNPLPPISAFDRSPRGALPPVTGSAATAAPDIMSGRAGQTGGGEPLGRQHTMPGGRAAAENGGGSSSAFGNGPGGASAASMASSNAYFVGAQRSSGDVAAALSDDEFSITDTPVRGRAPSNPTASPMNASGRSGAGGLSSPYLQLQEPHPAASFRGAQPPPPQQRQALPNAALPLSGRLSNAAGPAGPIAAAVDGSLASSGRGARGSPANPRDAIPGAPPRPDRLSPLEVSGGRGTGTDGSPASAQSRGGDTSSFNATPTAARGGGAAAGNNAGRPTAAATAAGAAAEEGMPNSSSFGSFALGAQQAANAGRAESAVVRSLSPSLSDLPLLAQHYLSGGACVLGWGSNVCGELGTGLASISTSAPVLQAPMPLSVSFPPPVSRHRGVATATTPPGAPVAVACGSQFTVWLMDAGGTAACGACEWGQLGVGTAAVTSSPNAGRTAERVPFIAAPTTLTKGLRTADRERIVAIKCGYAYAVALTATGEIFLWGNNNHSQCTVGSQLTEGAMRVAGPTKIALKKCPVVDVACGSFFVVALTEAKTILTWGLLSMLGLGTEEEAKKTVPSGRWAASLSREQRPVTWLPCRVTALDFKGACAIAAGQWHAAVVCTDGALYTWGVGHQGRLGHGVTTHEHVPRKVVGLNGFDAIAAACGSFHTAVVTSIGHLFCFGDNGNGQCGSPGAPFFAQPTKVEFPAQCRILAAGCGREHTCCLSADGDVFAFGSGHGLGAGLGCRPRFPVPRRIVTNTIVLSISLGVAHGVALGLQRKLSVSTVGVVGAAPNHGPRKIVELPDGHMSAAAGAGFMVLVDGLGRTSSVGTGDWGQLGLGAVGRLPRNQESVPCVTAISPIPALSTKRVMHVAAGYALAFAVTDAHEVFFWGNNNHCQGGLGVGRRDDKHIDTPTHVASLDGRGVVQIACGSFFTLAVTNAGHVFSWGVLDCCGHGSAEELDKNRDKVVAAAAACQQQRLPAAVSGVASGGSAGGPPASASMSSTLGGTANGSNVLAGAGVAAGSSELPAWEELVTTGATSEARLVLAQPVRIAGLSGVVTVAAGQWHCAALTDRGSIYTWGVGNQGRLGHGDTTPRFTPSKVEVRPSMPFSRIACGSFNTCAVSFEGSLFVWGDNEAGQCGVGSSRGSSQRPGRDEPRAVLAPRLVMENVRTAAMGRNHLVAVTEDGAICFAGQLAVSPDASQMASSGNFSPSSGNFDAAQSEQMISNRELQPHPAFAPEGWYAIDVVCGPHHVGAVVEAGRPSTAAVSEAVAALKARHPAGLESVAAADPARVDPDDLM